MTASWSIFLAVVQLAPSRVVPMNLGSFPDRAENSNAYVWAVRRVAGALD